MTAVLAAVAAAVTAVAGLAIAAPAEAAATKHPRIIAVAASTGYLVYRQKTSTAAGLTITRGSTLYARSASGHRHLLEDFDPQLFPTLQGSTLTESVQPNAKYGDDHDAAQPEHIRWRDLGTGATGVTEIPATDDYIGAAPGGWIAVRSAADGSSAHLIRYSTGGRVTDLGAPIADGSRFDVAPGPKGVLVYSEKDDDARSAGLIRYLPYSAGGRWRTLLAVGAGVDSTCGRPSESAVVCDVDRPGQHSREVLLSLTTDRKTWVSDHGTVCRTTAFVAVGAAAVGKDTTDLGPCARARLTRLSLSGKVTFSTVRWGLHASGIVEGFGRTLLDSSDQGRIVALTGVRGAARTVATAH